MNLGSILIEAAGWLGAGSLISAYTLVSNGKIQNGLTYQLLNLAGSIGLAVNSVIHRALPSAALNLVWLTIGLAALGRLYRRRQPGESRAHSRPQVTVSVDRSGGRPVD